MPFGTVTFDKEMMEARKDAQVRLLLDQAPFALIILGGAHDLAGNIDRLSDGKAEYIRVETSSWHNLSEKNE